MPEGNEIHRWAERHAAAFAGKPLRVDGPQGRFMDADVLDGRKLKRVMAVGKHLGYDFGKDRILHVHLGMRAGMVDRRIVTTRAKDRPHARGKALKEEAHYVYRRNGRPCFVCGTKVMKMEGFAGRNLFWCPVCQMIEGS